MWSSSHCIYTHFSCCVYRGSEKGDFVYVVFTHTVDVVCTCIYRSCESCVLFMSWFHNAFTLSVPVCLQRL